MVEFVFILMLLMILGVGMLYFFRLFLYDYWAAQEARYLAFEQTWPARGSYGDSESESVGEVSAWGVSQGRPRVVSDAPASRESAAAGSLSEMLPLTFARAEKVASTPADDARGVSGDVMYASVAGRLAFVGAAYASEKGEDSWRSGPGGVVQVRPEGKDRLSSAELRRPEIGRGLRGVLKAGGFGVAYCEALGAVAARYHFGAARNPFGEDGCAARAEKEFGGYLGEVLNVHAVFSAFSGGLEDGRPPGAAFGDALGSAVAEGFYSYFDQVAQSSAGDAATQAFLARLSDEARLGDASMARLISDMRYAGAAVAVQAIEAAFQSIMASSTSNRDPLKELADERAIQGFLLADAGVAMGSAESAYTLNAKYLPVPLTFAAAGGGLFDGLMRNVLSADGDQIAPFIDQSSHAIVVSYDASAEVAPAAKRRFATSGRTMSARYFLMTEPWHVSRRVNTTGAYRRLGSETDSVDDDSDEGVLRRRVLGLWLFPSAPGEFFAPLNDVSGIGAVSGVFESFQSAESVLGEVKQLAVDNPLLDFADALSQVPVLGNLVPVLPKWPAVRPAAYPGSKELENDRLMGTERTFQDYVNEQRDFNPPPAPAYN